MHTSDNYYLDFIYHSQTYQYCALIEVPKDKQSIRISFGLFGRATEKHTLKGTEVAAFAIKVIENCDMYIYQAFVDYLIQNDLLRNRVNEEDLGIIVKLATIGYIP